MPQELPQIGHSQLIAQAGEHPAADAQSTSATSQMQAAPAGTHEVGTVASTLEGTGAHVVLDEEAERKAVFNHVLDHQADTHTFDFFGAEIPLPYLFWDNGAMHMFGSAESLDESGVYTTEQHTGAPLHKADKTGVGLDLSITGNVLFLILGAIVLFLVARAAGSRAKKSLVPKGIHNMMESLVVFIRDEVVYPNVYKEFADPLMPFFLTIFFLILFLNLFGLVPTAKTVTSSISVTAALAVCVFVVTQFIGFKAMGVKNYLKHLTGGLIDMDIPIVMKIILVLIMIPIEILGLFTKPFALAVRLFANMTAGHIIIGSLIGLGMLYGSYVVLGAVSVPFGIFIGILELLVAFIQAYVFVMLSALFIGMMAHHEEDHDENDGGRDHIVGHEPGKEIHTVASAHMI